MNTPLDARMRHGLEAEHEAARDVPRPVSAYDIAAWILLAVGIVFTMHHHLTSALLSGLFVYAMVHRITGRLTLYRFAHNKAKVLAVLFVGLALVGIAAGIIFMIIGLVRGRIGNVPEMLTRISLVVETFRDSIKSPSIQSFIPDAEHLHEQIVLWLRQHSEDLKQVGGLTSRIVIHAIIGIVIGALLSFHIAVPGGPLAESLSERAKRLLNAFEAVVFAQIKISAVNTLLTSIYLLIILPLCGVELPFRKTLVLVTFVMGLLPVVGNLVSNTVIFLISLEVSSGVAVGSLIFLVVIHKLEYFLNAKIVGGHIHASAWEILIAMVVAEAAFGISGVIMAPIIYAYIKRELMDRRLV